MPCCFLDFFSVLDPRSDDNLVRLEEQTPKEVVLRGFLTSAAGTKGKGVRWMYCSATRTAIVSSNKLTLIPALAAFLTILLAADLGLGATYVQTTALLDWVFEAGKLPCIWAITQHAWCAPASAC